MPLEAPVIRTSFTVMGAMSPRPAYQIKATAAASRLTSLPEFRVEMWASRTVAQTLQTPANRRRGAGEVLPMHPRRYILTALILVRRRGSLHEVVLVRRGLCLGCGGALRGCGSAGECWRLQQIGGNRGRME